MSIQIGTISTQRHRVQLHGLKRDYLHAAEFLDCVRDKYEHKLNVHSGGGRVAGGSFSNCID